LYAAEIQKRFQGLGPDAALLHARARVGAEERVQGSIPRPPAAVC
jgi:hypothetical protein